MKSEKPLGPGTDRLRRKYDRGGSVKAQQPLSRRGELPGVQLSRSQPTMKARQTFGSGRPPDPALPVGAEQSRHIPRAGLAQQQWNHSRAVPEPQRPLRRSSSRPRNVLPSGSATREGLSRSEGSRPSPVRRTPARISRLLRSPPDSAPRAGIRRATGRPRSVTRTSSPFLTPRRYSESEVFSSETEAFFIGLV